MLVVEGLKLAVLLDKLFEPTQILLRKMPITFAKCLRQAGCRGESEDELSPNLPKRLKRGGQARHKPNESTQKRLLIHSAALQTHTYTQDRWVPVEGKTNYGFNSQIFSSLINLLIIFSGTRL